MYNCCDEDYKNIADYLDHRAKHAVLDGVPPQDPGRKTKACRVCRIITDDYAKFQRTCQDCTRLGFRRCTSCDKVKLKADFYKNVAYGKCAECRSGRGAEYKPRNPAFDKLSDDVLADIYQLLESRLLHAQTDGDLGEKHSYVSIATKHGIKPCNFHSWLRSGKLHPGFLGKSQPKTDSA